MTRRNKAMYYTVATVLFVYVMNYLQMPLISQDIVAFELAKTPMAATEMLQAWSNAGKLSPFKLHLVLDFAFLWLYGASFFYTCLWLEQVHPMLAWRSVAHRFGSFALAASLFDALEDLLMTWSVYAGATAWSTWGAYFFAIIKFTCLVICSLYCMTGLILILLRWLMEIVNKKEA